ncbi:hypothetical protein NP493_206g05016 [Ridgeia piscesae]|uniref:non-specific serine/threonine protein kinase n=1 Tax=Ridgeia piscesae TaxID=27915 RepID=A0AAD9UEG5_RIDPI|nr:hypothetical protein NP493_206g05016 [Ridgeia piscesae]
MGNLEKYISVTPIGQGSCGSVDLVRSVENKKLYALKKIELDENRKTRRKEAVLREAKILSELKHPHIVAYHDSFFDDKEQFLYIVQDYCDGGTLDDRIHEATLRRQYFTEKQVMDWFLQVSMAVRYIHSKKVLHRDLKAQNVFLNKSGSVCKLGDFGIAKNLDNAVDVANTCVGTPCYLSPEMCQDIPYSSKADIWALGCMLFEMLALKPAFDANNLVSLFYKIVKGEHDMIPEMFSQEMQNLVHTVLAKNPEDRPSARALLQLPYVRRELLVYLEEKEFQLQQLPTRQWSRPYSTPTASRIGLFSDAEAIQESRHKRVLSCRPTVTLQTSAKPERSGRVSTIPEETEDQMVRADRKLELQQEPLMEVNEDDVQTSTRSEPVTASQKSDTAVKADVKTGPNKTDAQKSVADSPKVTVARSEVKSESTVGKRVVAKQEQCKGLVEVKVDGDSVNDTVVMNAAAAKTSVKSNAEVALSSPRNVTKMPSEHSTQKVSPKFQQNGVKPSVGGSQKVNIPPLVKTSDKAVKSDSTEYKSQRIQRKDTDRTQPKESSPQPAKLPDAIVGRNFEDTSNTVQHRRQAAQPRGGRGPTPNPLILKESQRTKVVSNKMKQGVKFPPLLSTATGGGEKRRKSTSGSRHSDRPKTRDSLISVPFDPSLIDYYSDDFDDSSDSDVDEDIPEELCVYKYTTQCLSLTCGDCCHSEVNDIEEDLPGGEMADDDDLADPEEVDEELSEVVSVAREVCDDRGCEVADETIVDESAWPTSTTKLIKKQCMDTLDSKSREKLKRTCINNKGELECK